MNTWLVPANELTLEQLRAVELDHKKHRVIMGGAGFWKNNRIAAPGALFT
ncbi:MAG: hypothetical protein ACOX1J_02270 [Dethiobacteria bacterium]